MLETPFYRLKQLIIEKYGDEKFTTGCALVAAWVSAETKEKVDALWVQLISKISEAHPVPVYQLSGPQAKALKSLFKLDSYKELYTIPETCPKFFN